jgi:CubicO group peptidase (beta-lactamase class C family)
MRADTPLDLASLTKLFTATLAGALVDRGWLSFETELRAVLPEFTDPRVRIHHLLSHTAGFVAWQPFWEKLRAAFPPGTLHEVPIATRQREMRRIVCAIRPEVAPGERTLYSDLSFLLLGFALQNVPRMELDRAIEHLVWEPLGIEGCFFRRTTRPAAAARMDEVAATEDCPWRGAVLQGQVHDDNCWSMGGYGGHAGAFGRAEDLLRFARGLWLGKLLTPRTLRALWTRAALPPGCERTLGWDTPSGTESSTGRHFSRSSVGHLGFTGTSLWIDPDAGIAVTLLSNRVHPSRENPKIRAFRPRFHDALREDLLALK